MSNIDKHAVQAVADLKAGYTLGHADVAILNELARIALASLEAEAVISHVGSKNALDAIVAFIKSNRNPTLKVYNEVSERLFQDNCHGLSNHVIEYIKQIGEELLENACRAAILQGAEPVSNRDELPDGWVACSERMPETAGNYWGWWSESKRQGPVWFIKSELQAQFQSSEITHWMPLPAAPQREGENV
ncbi:DUF551 domain-containing protein [Enterobacter hormaechei]|nr:DUF551 domain-containing protein [Enterobacter hormaechei]